MPDTMTLLSLRINNILANTVRTTTKQQPSNGFQHRMLCMLLMMRVRIFLHCTRYVAGDDAPKVLEYVPTPHGVHDVDANAMAAYVPPAHVKQMVDALPEE